MFGKKKKVVENPEPEIEVSENEQFENQITELLLKGAIYFDYYKIAGYIITINGRRYVLKVGYKPLIKIKNEEKYHSNIRNQYASAYVYDPTKSLFIDYYSHRSYPYYYDKLSSLIYEWEHCLVDNKSYYIARVIVAVEIDENREEKIDSSTVHRAYRTDFMFFPPKAILSDMDTWRILSTCSSNKAIKDMTPNLLFRVREIGLKKAVQEYELQKRKQELSILDLGEKMTEYIAASPNATTLALGLYRNTIKFGQYELDKIIEERRLDVYGRNDSK